MKKELLNKSTLGWLFLIVFAMALPNLLILGTRSLADSNLEKRAKIYHDWSVSQKEYMKKQDEFYNKQK